MNHYMKGNIMIFISGSENCEIKNIRMESIGNDGTKCDCDELRYIDYNIVANGENQINYDLFYKNYLGNNINSIVLTQSSNINISNIICKNMKTLNGKCKGVHLINNNNNITTNNINIVEIDGINTLLSRILRQYIRNMQQYIKFYK